MRPPSLRSQLNQIRLWLRQGRTDAWIAHKLDISVGELESFKRDHRLTGDPPPAPVPEVEEIEEVEEVEELEEIEEIEEAKEAAPAKAPDEMHEVGMRGEEEADGVEWEKPDAGVSEDDGDTDETEITKAAEAAGPTKSARSARAGGEEEQPRKRRRGRRGGRRRAPGRTTYEATFDHGEDGYGLWLDPSVADDQIYSEHWAGHRPVIVTVEVDTITIRRSGGSDES